MPRPSRAARKPTSWPLCSQAQGPRKGGWNHGIFGVSLETGPPHRRHLLSSRPALESQQQVRGEPAAGSAHLRRGPRSLAQGSGQVFPTGRRVRHVARAKSNTASRTSGCAPVKPRPQQQATRDLGVVGQALKGRRSLGGRRPSCASRHEGHRLAAKDQAEMHRVSS